jgi:hypothetical protein
VPKILHGTLHQSATEYAKLNSFLRNLKEEQMKGQWIGSYEGTTQGDLILNLESFDIETTQGRLTLIDRTPNSPSFTAPVNRVISPSETETTIEVGEFVPLNPELFSPAQTEDEKKRIVGDSPIPQKGTLQIHLVNDGQRQGSLITNLKTSFNIWIKPEAKKISQILSEKISWREFENFVESAEAQNQIFRGQNNISDPLRTIFHRRGRSDLMRYKKQDIPEFEKQVSTFYPNHKKYNLNNLHELGELLFLGQHHGYPTPLLDWTESPFVAAYFAFAKARLAKNHTHVRIFSFNEPDWVNCNLQIPPLSQLNTLSLTIGRFISPLTNRPAPQKALSLYSNIDDIETFITREATKHRKKFLRVFDISISERTRVMRQLDLLGINAATLFPDFDGICRMLDEKYFI